MFISKHSLNYKRENSLDKNSKLPHKNIRQNNFGINNSDNKNTNNEPILNSNSGPKSLVSKLQKNLKVSDLKKEEYNYNKGGISLKGDLHGKARVCLNSYEAIREEDHNEDALDLSNKKDSINPTSNDERKRQSLKKIKCIGKEISFEEKLSRVNNNYFNSKYFKVLNKKAAKKQNIKFSNVNNTDDRTIEKKANKQNRNIQ